MQSNENEESEGRISQHLLKANIRNIRSLHADFKEIFGFCVLIKAGELYRKSGRKYRSTPRSDII